MQKKNNPVVVNDAMPHDPRAESAIIGCLLVPGSDAYDDVATLISAESFYSAVDKMIYGAVESMINRDVAVDSITVADELRRRGQLEEVGGMRYMIDCVNKTASLLHAKDAALIVRRTYKLRKLVLAARAIVAKVGEWQEADADALVGECESEILDATSDEKIGDGTELVEQLTSYYEALEERRKHPGRLTGISTGLKDLDMLLCGLNDGDYIILAGRPSMGKSALLVRLAASAAAADHRVLYFSAEMTTYQLLNRFAGMQSGIDMTKIRDGRLTDEEMARIGQALAGMSEYDCTVYNNMGIETIRSTCRREVRKANGRRVLVIVDHMGYVSCAARNYGERRVLEVGHISKQFKAMAMELQVPTVVASQLNRKVEGRSNKRPILSDLRDSGDIEQDADVVAFLYRDEYYDPETLEPKVLEIDIPKQRNGPVGVVRVWYDTSTNVFANLELKKLDEELIF